jgi:exodeoxyribonuclease-3
MAFMLVATFNCNSVRQRQGIILQWLEQHQPDLLALQETKVMDEQFPLEPFTSAGWHVAYRGQKSYNGVAMISRQEPTEVSFGLQDGDDDESGPRLAAVKLGPVHVVNTYVPQGQALDSPKFQFKLEWFARLRRYFEQRFSPTEDQVLWVGDLNVAPTPADVYDSKRVWPHVCHSQEVIDAFQPVIDWGFQDVFRKHLPQEDIFTFWDYRARNALAANRGWRIDHIQATAPLAARSVGCEVDIEPRRMEKPSDHTFVAARFE